MLTTPKRLLVSSSMGVVLGVGSTLLVSALGDTSVKYDARASVGVAKADLQALVSNLEQYKNIGGMYPSEEQGLEAFLERPKTPPIPRRWTQTLKDKDDLLDPWGIEYQYKYAGSEDEKPIITSAGPDKKFGTADDLSSKKKG